MLKFHVVVFRFIISWSFGFFLGSLLVTQCNRLALEHTKASINDRSSNVKDRREVLKLGTSHGHTCQGSHATDHRGILYIGVMSTKKHLDTRVSAMLNTWARHPEITVEIFADFANETETSATQSGRYVILESGTKLISLPGVPDISYPPQKKSFSMFKYIHDNHLNKFEWFLRADDDIYIKVDKLLQFLRKIDSGKPYFIGQPGYGKHAGDHLNGENYCMGGTGIFMSRELLRKVGPELSRCVRQLYTEHEDIEIGRCVGKVTGVRCTAAWEAPILFYENYDKKGTQQDNIQDLSERKRADAVTFHPNKDPIHQYKFHLSISSDKIRNILLQIIKMENDLKKMSVLIDVKRFDKARNISTSLVWDVATTNSTYSATSNAILQISSVAKEAVVKTASYGASSELCRRRRLLNSEIEEIELTKAWRRVNPLSSEDTIADLKVHLKPKKATRYWKNVYLRRSFTKSLVYLRETQPITPELIANSVSKSDKNPGGVRIEEREKIHFIVASSEDLGRFQRFLKNFEETFLVKDENVTLTIAYFPQNVSSVTATEPDIDNKEPRFDTVAEVTSGIALPRYILSSLSEKYPKLSAQLILVRKRYSFSRGAGLQFVARSTVGDGILFFCDVNHIFSPEISFHIRKAAIKGKQAYLPIVLSDPRVAYPRRGSLETSFSFEEGAGFWRNFNYGMVAIYKSDFFNSGGFDLSISGCWALADMSLCEKSPLKAKLDVFRANDPAVIHDFHSMNCLEEFAREQQKSCRKNGTSHLGAQAL